MNHGNCLQDVSFQFQVFFFFKRCAHLFPPSNFDEHKNNQCDVIICKWLFEKSFQSPHETQFRHSTYKCVVQDWKCEHTQCWAPSSNTKHIWSQTYVKFKGYFSKTSNWLFLHTYIRLLMKKGTEMNSKKISQQIYFTKKLKHF